MVDEKMFNFDEVAAKLKISKYTLRTWYTWESKLLREGSVKEHYLPIPYRATNERGVPKYFTKADIEKLAQFKANMVVGRNGIYGKFSNPNHKEKEEQ